MVWKKQKQEIGPTLAQQAKKAVDEVEEFEEESEEEVQQPPMRPKQQLPKQNLPRDPEFTWVVGKIASQYEPTIHNLKTGEHYSLFQAIAILLERTE